MAGFGDTFDDPDTGGNASAFAAPGLHAAALSGNPMATLTNLNALAGMQAGRMVGGALSDVIGGAMGAPMVDPMALAQQRQAEYIAEYDRLRADGMSAGRAIEQAAKTARLAPDERLRAMQLGAERQEGERKALKDASDAVLKSDAVKNFQKSKGLFKELRNIAQRGKAGEQSANDFLLIQQGLKILDPGSVVSANEMSQGNFAARGTAALSFAGINVNQLINYAAGRGTRLEFTPEQKAKWLKAIGTAVDGQRNAASSVYLANRDAYVAGGGSQDAYSNALATTNDLLQGSAYTAIEELEQAGSISEGRGFNDNGAKIIAATKNIPEVFTPLLQGFARATKDVAVDLLFDWGDDEPISLTPNKSKSKKSRSITRDKLKQNSQGDLTRMVAPKVIDGALLSSYPTENIMHAMTMDALDGSPIGNKADAMVRLAMLSKV